MSNLLRAEFVSADNGKILRGYRTHLNDSTNKPLCGCRNRIALGDTVATRWLIVQGESPTCPACDRIAKRRMGGDAA
jgi:hypothetical protein